MTSYTAAGHKESPHKFDYEDGDEAPLPSRKPTQPTPAAVLSDSARTAASERGTLAESRGSGDDCLQMLKESNNELAVMRSHAQRLARIILREHTGWNFLADDIEFARKIAQATGQAVSE